MLWKKTFGGSNDENCAHAVRTRNGDFVAIGTTTSFNNGFIDWSMMRIDSTGSLLWYKTYGIVGANSGTTNFLQEPDGSFVIIGYAHVGYQNQDMVVIKTDSARQYALVTTISHEFQRLWMRDYKGQ